MKETDATKYITVFSAGFENPPYDDADLRRQSDAWDFDDPEIQTTLGQNVTLKRGESNLVEGKYTMTVYGYYPTEAEIPEEVTLKAGTVLNLAETCKDNIIYFNVA